MIMTSTHADGEARTFILFTVAGSTYAALSRRVRHVEMVEEVTPVPNAPPFIDGVVFSRGQVVPVMNLRVRFGFERTARDLRTRLLIVESGGRMVGLLADAAREFMVIPEAAVQPPGASISGLSGNYLEGIATLGDRIVLIVDIENLIDVAPSAAA
jgi:purine-binding chemotaxis protein CheW